MIAQTYVRDQLWKNTRALRGSLSNLQFEIPVHHIARHHVRLKAAFKARWDGSEATVGRNNLQVLSTLCRIGVDGLSCLQKFHLERNHLLFFAILYSQ